MAHAPAEPEGAVLALPQTGIRLGSCGSRSDAAETILASAAASKMLPTCMAVPLRVATKDERDLFK
jgi:hypothetical protein